MIKAAGKMGGKPLLILGLTQVNMTRLLSGDPIMLDSEALGLAAMKVLIVGGVTEDAIVKELTMNGFIGPETERRGI